MLKQITGFAKFCSGCLQCAAHVPYLYAQNRY